MISSDAAAAEPGSGAAPLSYIVRRSAKARHARLVASPRDGLVVVVPRRFNLGLIPELVAERADWAERALRRIESERASIMAEPTTRPARLELRAIGEEWSVDYLDERVGRVSVRAIGERALRVSGANADEEAIAGALCRWLTGRGRAVVPTWVERLADRHAIEVTGITIRAQRSRWASCSNEGRISVNRTVLFLPPELAEHVLLHELCHRQEMSHSPRFWSALEAIDPGTATHRVALRSAWKYVPTWALPDQLSGLG